MDSAPPPPYSRLQEEHDEAPNPFNHVDGPISPNTNIELQPSYTSHQDTHTVTCQSERYVLQPTNASAPPSYDCIAIASILFCMPMAVCAIIYAHHSSLAASEGDLETARSKGIIARNIAIAAIVIGVGTIVLVAVFNADIYRLYKTL